MKRNFPNSIITRLNPLRNIYLLAFLLFAMWMLFFDANKIQSQLNSSNKLAKLEEEKNELLEKISNTETELAELKVNKEKFAREQYYMKKDDEDVFIIELNK